MNDQQINETQLADAVVLPLEQDPAAANAEAMVLKDGKLIGYVQDGEFAAKDEEAETLQ